MSNLADYLREGLDDPPLANNDIDGCARLLGYCQGLLNQLIELVGRDRCVALAPNGGDLAKHLADTQVTPPTPATAKGCADTAYWLCNMLDELIGLVGRDRVVALVRADDEITEHVRQQQEKPKEDFELARLIFGEGYCAARQQVMQILLESKKE